MQSIQIFTAANATRATLFLDRFCRPCTASSRPYWLLPREGDSRMTVYLETAVSPDMEDELRAAEQILGAPLISILADVSRRGGGMKLAREFACSAVEALSGVALDDYSDWLWSLEELRALTDDDTEGFASGY